MWSCFFWSFALALFWIFELKRMFVSCVLVDSSTASKGGNMTKSHNVILETVLNEHGAMCVFLNWTITHLYWRQWFGCLTYASRASLMWMWMWNAFHIFIWCEIVAHFHLTLHQSISNRAITFVHSTKSLSLSDHIKPKLRKCLLCH